MSTRCVEKPTKSSVAMNLRFSVIYGQETFRTPCPSLFSNSKRNSMYYNLNCMLLKISLKMMKFKSNKFATLIFITLVMWKCECNMFNLPHDHEINNPAKIWLGARFGSCRYCGTAYITFLICYMTSRENTIREPCDLFVW